MNHPRRGWSSSDSERKVWEPVQIPRPVFSSPAEKRRIEQAMVDHPRRPGEEIVDWIERVNAAAGVTALAETGLPYREPGSADGD